MNVENGETLNKGENLRPRETPHRIAFPASHEIPPSFFFWKQALAPYMENYVPKPRPVVAHEGVRGCSRQYEYLYI